MSKFESWIIGIFMFGVFGWFVADDCLDKRRDATTAKLYAKYLNLEARVTAMDGGDLPESQKFKVSK